MTKHLGTLHPQKNRLNYKGLYLELGRKNDVYLHSEGFSRVRQRLDVELKEKQKESASSALQCLCASRVHTCALCGNTLSPLCIRVDVNGMDVQPAAAAVLSETHREKDGKQESNGHRFFNLTPYWFLLSPPRWCPGPSAATDLTDREERWLRKKELVETKSLCQPVCQPSTPSTG